MQTFLGSLGDLTGSARDAASGQWSRGRLDSQAGPHKNFRLLETADGLVTDSELLEMTLFRVVPSKHIYHVVKALLAQFGTFAGTVTAPQRELRKIRGLGHAGATTLKTVPLAAEKLSNLKDIERLRLETPTELRRYLSTKLDHETTDLLFVAYLNSKNDLIADEIETGSPSLSNAIDKRRFLNALLSHYATAIILVHYRPGRDAQPCPYDYDVIEIIQSFAGPLSFVLQDYIIIGKTRWISFQKERLLKIGLGPYLQRLAPMREAPTLASQETNASYRVNKDLR